MSNTGFTGRQWLPALLVQAAIFVGFHFRAFRSIRALPGMLVVAVVLFLTG